MTDWFSRPVLAAALALGVPAAAQDILIGVPTSLTGVVGVADHGDWLNGVNMAIESINGAGGVNGRMLRAEGGATIDEIVAALEWQSHTARGAMSGALKKKLGLTITSEKVDGRGRVYTIR